MKTVVLTDRLLGAAGAQMRETEVYDSAGPFDGRSSLASIDFASLPRSAGFDGICEADTINVFFDSPTRQRSASTPNRITSVSTGKSFAVLPDYVADPVRAESAAAQERACNNLGPVLARWDSPVQRGFFSGFIDDFRTLHAVDLNFAVRGLLAARKAVASGGLIVACHGDAADPTDALCRDAPAALAGLAWQALVFIQLSWCDDTRAARCVELHFGRPETSKWQDRRIVVAIATDTAKIDPPGKTISARSVSLSGETLAD